MQQQQQQILVIFESKLERVVKVALALLEREVTKKRVDIDKIVSILVKSSAVLLNQILKSNDFSRLGKAEKHDRILEILIDKVLHKLLLNPESRFYASFNNLRGLVERKISKQDLIDTYHKLLNKISELAMKYSFRETVEENSRLADFASYVLAEKILSLLIKGTNNGFR